MEPAGYSCLCVKNTLAAVNVDTASRCLGQSELNIVGLKEPLAFKELVWAMKRTYGNAENKLVDGVYSVRSN